MKTMHETITKYIDDAIDKAVDKAVNKAVDRAISKQDASMRVYVKKISDEGKQHLTDLVSTYRSDIAAMKELSVTESRVREIVREEIR